MAELVVIAFKGIHQAAEMLDKLEGMQEPYDSTMQVEDALVVYRESSGALKFSESLESRKGEGARIGAAFGALLGALIAAPFTAGASAAGIAAFAASTLRSGALGGAGGTI